MSNIYLYSVQLARMYSTVYINFVIILLSCILVKCLYAAVFIKFYISFILIIFRREVLNMVVLVEDKV